MLDLNKEFDGKDLDECHCFIGELVQEVKRLRGTSKKELRVCAMRDIIYTIAGFRSSVSDTDINRIARKLVEVGFTISAEPYHKWINDSCNKYISRGAKEVLLVLRYMEKLL